MTLEIIKLYVIKPTKTTDLNLVTNPSFEVSTAGYTTGGTNTIAVSTAQARRGVSSCLCTYQDNDAFIIYATTLTAATYTFSVDVYIPTAYDGTDLVLSAFNFAGSAITVGRPNMTIRDRWQRVHAHITPVGGDLTGSIYIYENGTNATAGRFIYVDGVQIELGSEPTTYFDGVQDDCYWNGQAHLSTSTRKATTRRGGTLVNLENYLSISTIAGLGMGPFYSAKTPTLSGRSLFQKTLKSDREIVISGEILGNNYGELQTARQGLIDLFKPDYVTGDQDVTLRYIAETAAGVQASEPVDIRVRMRSDGLIGNWQGPTFERVSLVLEAYDDLIRDGNNANALGYQTTVANMANIMQRGADGIWAPMATGVNGIVRCMAIHPITGDLYIGGDFTNAGGDANADYLARWNGTAFVSVVAGFTASVVDMAFDLSGNLYIVGNFTNIGDANGDYVVKWNGSALSSLGTGLNANAMCVEIGHDGFVYVGGEFTSAGGVANTARIAKWNGTTWVTVGGGMTSSGYVSDIVFDKSGNMYICGSWDDFVDANGDCIAKFNGTIYSSLGPGISTNTGTYNLNKLLIDHNETLYIGGYFIDETGLTYKNHFVKWNGVSFEAIGQSLGYTVYDMFEYENKIYIGGEFITANGYTLPDRMCIFQNNTYLPVDINVQDVSASIYSILVNKNTGVLYIGGGWTGTDAISATVTTSSVTGTSTYPKIVITGPGTIWQIKNYTNGKTVYFDGLTLLAGEVITLDFEAQSYISTFRGNILNYIIEGISTLDFNLEPGSNNVSAYLFGSTTAASAITMTYKVRYWSVDEAQL